MIFGDQHTLTNLFMKAKSENELGEVFNKESFESIDYVASCDLLKNYSGMRILALGGAITLLVTLLSFDRSNSVVKESIQNIILLLANYISIRVICSINSNVYARCLHLEWIELRFNKIGFFSYWNKYVLKQSKNASSNAFLISCKGFNYISIIVICVSTSELIFKRGWITILPSFSFNMISSIEYTKFAFLMGILSLSLICFLINQKYLSNMRTKKLIPKLRESLERERVSVQMTI